MQKRMLSYLFWGIAAYVLFGGILFGCQRSLMYHPNQSVPEPADYGMPNVSLERVETEGPYKLLAWWRRPRSADMPLIVYFHGNAGHLGHRAEKIRPLLKSGYGVLLVSYRYNGGAGGSPSEAGLYADGRAAMQFVNRSGIASDRIVLYGESLGTAVAVKMANEHNVAAVILEAPYTSIADVAQKHYWYLPAKFLVLDKFNTAAMIGGVGAPLLIVHGDRDAIIPAAFGRALFSMAEEPKEAVFIPDAGHNDLHQHGLAGYVDAFLKRHEISR